MRKLEALKYKIIRPYMDQIEEKIMKKLKEDMDTKEFSVWGVSVTNPSYYIKNKNAIEHAVRADIPFWKEIKDKILDNWGIKYNVNKKLGYIEIILVASRKG